MHDDIPLTVRRATRVLTERRMPGLQLPVGLTPPSVFSR